LTADPFLQPFQLKHLTLKNRLMTTAHEPAYAEDGLPKDRYRIGDAITSRNIHAAIYDALRLAKDF
jgi:hypothetical protein